ncbi:response regulator [Ponticoccus sp. SC2-23]|uniref:response regulator n=1 Tax=Alexandriicola marinus TaxID=2081710 RepID=UPI000FDB71B6|nr:response regulator [Alexandriicola marinus]MBM1220548.1 response regulator [Ponticoccus sp. SC6-9]MBM1225234.1 response regulator [Ponticoccus sp. SC6-15]MBM1228748.1 response regulator [Ponticoccus sp. SC6-38]MBM1233615.1 response regulator [Ponticoccus sp. SC6-45]MBM1239249.1 response regulator [Ponticoccus sp. SC6-49]MBM1243031.1 response regulator [Ponticoccus sp. SC2-64]MBM1247139.1 response regulator [Ponticoccus sp. SC6-42]MBM1252202.1 response regulator [Ponticoccus sp. SC6-33]M
MSERHHHGTSDSPGAADADRSTGKDVANIADPNGLSDGLDHLLSSIEGRRILVVEDEILVAGELADDIEELGGEVVGPAYSMSDALRISGSSEIDAAILDINLNGKEVFPVSDLLQARGIPFIFHTGTVKGPSALKLYDGVPVVSKPSLTIDLLQALQSVLGS